MKKRSIMILFGLMVQGGNLLAGPAQSSLNSYAKTGANISKQEQAAAIGVLFTFAAVGTGLCVARHYALQSSKVQAVATATTADVIDGENNNAPFRKSLISSSHQENLDDDNLSRAFDILNTSEAQKSADRGRGGNSLSSLNGSVLSTSAGCAAQIAQINATVDAYLARHNSNSANGSSLSSAPQSTVTAVAAPASVTSSRSGSSRTSSQSSLSVDVIGKAAETANRNAILEQTNSTVTQVTGAVQRQQSAGGHGNKRRSHSQRQRD